MDYGQLSTSLSWPALLNGREILPVKALALGVVGDMLFVSCVDCDASCPVCLCDSKVGTKGAEDACFKTGRRKVMGGGTCTRRLSGDSDAGP